MAGTTPSSQYPQYWRQLLPKRIKSGTMPPRSPYQISEKIHTGLRCSLYFGARPRAVCCLANQAIELVVIRAVLAAVLLGTLHDNQDVEAVPREPEHIIVQNSMMELCPMTCKDLRVRRTFSRPS